MNQEKSVGQDEGYLDKLFSNLPPETKKWATEQIEKGDISLLGCSDAQIIAEYEKSLGQQPQQDKKEVESLKTKKKKKKSRNQKDGRRLPKDEEPNQAMEIEPYMEYMDSGQAPQTNPPIAQPIQNNTNDILWTLKILFVVIFATTAGMFVGAELFLSERQFLLGGYKVKNITKDKDTELNVVVFTAILIPREENQKNTCQIIAYPDEIKLEFRNDIDATRILATAHFLKYNELGRPLIHHPKNVTVQIPIKFMRSYEDTLLSSYFMQDLQAKHKRYLEHLKGAGDAK